MQESAQAALSYVRSRARDFGIRPKRFEKTDVHVHVPEGAIPKDGPSAGITIATALVSAFTGIPVRRDTAMTGEITLRGRVLPIGGWKEKILAAHRAGIQRVILPKKNQRDLVELPRREIRGMTLIFVETMEEVLRAALARPLQGLRSRRPARPPAGALERPPSTRSFRFSRDAGERSRAGDAFAALQDSCSQLSHDFGTYPLPTEP
jgi:ATP-dependent Lon protease